MERLAVYPASLDPIHNGHIDIAARAARLFDRVIVAVYAMPKKRLLFDADDRQAMAEEAFKAYDNIEVAQYSELTVNYAQRVGAMALIRGLRVFSDFELEFRMGVANKKLAPDIEMIAIMSDEKHLHISSSMVREIAELGGDVSSMVPPFVEARLAQRFAELQQGKGSPGYSISIRD